MSIAEIALAVLCAGMIFGIPFLVNRIKSRRNLLLARLVCGALMIAICVTSPDVSPWWLAIMALCVLSGAYKEFHGSRKLSAVR